MNKATMTPPVASVFASAPRRSVLRVMSAYIALTKPRIIELLLVTTIPTMMLAQGGLPPWLLMINTLVGGAAAAGSANAFNSYLDRDIDQVMNRTRRRPLVTGEVKPRSALIFASVLGVVAVAWLWVYVNLVSALFAVLAIAIYVVGYTIILKRRTPQNIVWGGIAGCMPVLIGWSAVTGHISWAAMALFGVIFFWTPPHYWPLSMKFKQDYAAAQVPMLPVVASERRVAIEMSAHTVAMVACSLALTPLAGMSWVYTTSAVLLGGWFGSSVVGMMRAASHSVRFAPMRVFRASITYLSALFFMVAIDTVLPW